MTARTASTPLRQPAAVPQMSDDDQCINTIRTLAIDAVQKANSGHAGTPMALVPVVYTLWQEFLRYDPAEARMNPVRALHDYGQSVWLDFLARGFIAKGKLKSLIDFAKQVLSAMRKGFGGHIEPDKAARA
jgi:transketolase N-terminal domain/subunit